MQLKTWSSSWHSWHVSTSNKFLLGYMLCGVVSMAVIAKLKASHVNEDEVGSYCSMRGTLAMY